MSEHIPSGTKPTLSSNPCDGWRCFHCGEVFTAQVDARNHFGRDEGAEPACLIKAPGEFALLQALRNAEDQLARYRSEDSDVLRSMWSMQSDHMQAIRREEEKGYERGLRDARNEANGNETRADYAALCECGWQGHNSELTKNCPACRMVFERPALKANACQCDPNPSIGGSPPCPVHDGESESEV